MNFKLIVSHEPFFNPTVGFDWPTLYCRWYWVAWLIGAWMLLTRPYATNARIYKRNT